MKCKNCGANYPMREMRCPYCGTVNARGLRQQCQLERADEDLEKAETEGLEKIQLRMVNRVLNVSLVLEIAAIALLVAGVIVYGFGYDITRSTKRFLNSDQMNAHMEQLYTENRLDELWTYLHENDLRGEDYYEYMQAALIGFDYRQFKCARMTYLDTKQELDEYTVSSLLDNIQELLYFDCLAYPELTERNEVIWNRCSRDAEVFARVVLGFDDAQIEILKQKYVPSKDMNALKELVMQRGGGNEA